MKALGVVDSVDEDTDGTSCVRDVLEAAAVDFFGLEGHHEAFGFGIVTVIHAMSIWPRCLTSRQRSYTTSSAALRARSASALGRDRRPRCYS